jgi:NADPH-dependent F420 reductase
MRIGIVGGTGGMGEGFALRWCFKHDVVIGSRDTQKAKAASENYVKIARSSYGSSMIGSISGNDNFSLAEGADVVVLSIPYESIDDTCKGLNGHISTTCIVVSPIVPLGKSDAGFDYIPMVQEKKPAAELVAEGLGPRSRIVSAFHSISEVKLKDIKSSLDADTFVCGDDMGCVSAVNSLISEINGLRSIYLGPLAMSYQAEALTSMLLNASRKNKIKNPGIKLVY